MTPLHPNAHGFPDPRVRPVCSKDEPGMHHFTIVLSLIQVLQHDLQVPQHIVGSVTTYPPTLTGYVWGSCTSGDSGLVDSSRTVGTVERSTSRPFGFMASMKKFSVPP